MYYDGHFKMAYKAVMKALKPQSEYKFWEMECTAFSCKGDAVEDGG
jgi:hypothetical protein